MNDRSILDADIVDALIAAQRPDNDADAAALQRVRTRLMKRVAADSTSHHVAIAAEAGSWHRFLPGIERKVLQEREGVMSYLLKFAPGAVLPAHRHPHDEECVVLEGEVSLGEIRVRSGDYHLAPGGSRHGELRSESGALLFLRTTKPFPLRAAR